MKIYRRAQRYSPTTGRPVRFELVESGACCDITGEPIEGDSPAIIFDFKTIDPCFGASCSEYDFGKKYKINMHEFLGQPYEFHNFDTYAYLRAVIAQRCRGLTLDQSLRKLRIEAAEKLIADKVIEPWQLNSKELWEEDDEE